MNSLMTMMMLTLTMSSIMAMLAFWLPIIKPDSEKLSPYECGFDPQGSARLAFSIRFFLVAILFLLFDLEITLLLPSPWATNISHPELTFLWTFLFILLLTLGLIYEWLQGGLDWAE
uniref:NADH-ubiquinone oxidoreductase chain 3 n=2 Tax=Ichthyomyzon TaxID=7772 RepID=A7YDI5_9PETR|nr:NADH dehydrogenase subunit 3 [Ichthyomyzon gagei]ABK19988.1 NADH dehydrogenase subunit 3 [Ichthyomyzon castaneus]AQX92050.1 NADH dehydrogenase subunit 3 [Ichthyomyzon gagei]